MPYSPECVEETVWKIAEGFSVVGLCRQEAADQGSSGPSWRSSELRFETQAEFPNSFLETVWKFSTEPRTEDREPTKGQMSPVLTLRYPDLGNRGDLKLFSKQFLRESVW